MVSQQHTNVRVGGRLSQVVRLKVLARLQSCEVPWWGWQVGRKGLTGLESLMRTTLVFAWEKEAL